MPGGVITNNYGEEFYPSNPLAWEEEVGDEGRRSDTITHGESLCTLRGYVLDHKFVSAALVYWLGYSWVDYTYSPPILRRRCPAPHPESNFLFAKRVQIHGWKYQRKQVIKQQDFGFMVPFAKYERYYLEIDFCMAPWKVLPDFYVKPNGQPISDWERFITVEPNDDTEILTVDGGNYLLRGGALAGVPCAINGPKMTRYVERTAFTVTAHQLPYDLICDPYDIPVKFMKAKGRVNGDDNGSGNGLLGRNDQTMLLLTYKIDKYPQPVKTDTWTVLQFGCDVEFRFSYQEPTKATASETMAGWNLVPGINPELNGGWYGAELVPPGSNIPQYPSVKMKNLLTHWSANDL